MRRNTCNSEAPSMRAASMISSGIDLMAADSTTMAKPVWIQIMITMSSRLFHGRCDSHATGSWPRPSLMPLSRPMLVPKPSGR